MKVVLMFPHGDVETVLPLIPRKGDWLSWQRAAEAGDTSWMVRDVEWVCGEAVEPSVSIVLVPGESPDEGDAEVLAATEADLGNLAE